MVHFFLFYFWVFGFFWRGGGVWWCCILYPLPFSKFQFKMIMVYMYVMYLCVKMMGYDYTELICCRCLIPSSPWFIWYHHSVSPPVTNNTKPAPRWLLPLPPPVLMPSKLTLKMQKKEISISVHFLQYFEMLQIGLTVRTSKIWSLWGNVLKEDFRELSIFDVFL